MRRNSGIIGLKQSTSTSVASGIFDTFDQYNNSRANNWPPNMMTYSVSIPSTINEGSQFTATITTANVPNNTTLYYTILQVGGTITTSDFYDGTLSGSFIITSNSGSFSKSLVLDGTTETGDSFQVQIRTSSTSGPIVATSQTCSINEPSFTFIILAPTDVNEGQQPQGYFTATNVSSTTLYWRTSASADDITSGVTQGTWAYTAGGGNVVQPYMLKTDMITEGNETHTLSVYDVTNTYLLTSTTYTAVDTSTAPTISPSSTSVNEGDTVTFTVTCYGQTSGTIYWATNGTMTANDFTDGTISGSAALTASGSNSTATITRTARRDFVTDGSKTFQLLIYRDGAGSTLVATSATITVADTCQVPTITPSSLSINEGATITFTIATTGLANGTVLPYKMNFISATGSGSGNTTDFSDLALTGTVTINSNAGSFNKTWASDTYTEGIEIWNVTLYPPTGDILASTAIVTSSNITVADASTGTAEPAGSGSTLYKTPGTYSWTAPAGVTTVSVVAVGGGGGGAGSGGGVAVTAGGTSYFINTSTCAAEGGGKISGSSNGSPGNPGGTGGAVLAGTGTSGATGPNRVSSFNACGGGGAGMLNGGKATNGTENSWAGGGGYGADLYGNTIGTAGGASSSVGESKGGAGGVYGGGAGGGRDGMGGGGGAIAYINNYTVVPGNSYAVVVGAGGVGENSGVPASRGGGTGGIGAVRIIWPGSTRQFPSTGINVQGSENQI